jgi:hypothetical protein
VVRHHGGNSCWGSQHKQPAWHFKACYVWICQIHRGHTVWVFCQVACTELQRVPLEAGGAFAG